MNTSPFRAGFGKSPPGLAGTDDVLETFRSALTERSWSSARTSINEGHRGAVKTVYASTSRRASKAIESSSELGTARTPSVFQASSAAPKTS